MNDDLVTRALQFADQVDALADKVRPPSAAAAELHMAAISFRAAISVVEGEGWQPIDSAPEGEPILVCSDKDLDDYTVETMTVRINSEDVKHRFFNLNSGNFSRHDWWTHWRPLPQPPVSKGETM